MNSQCPGSAQYSHFPHISHSTLAELSLAYSEWRTRQVELLAQAKAGGLRVEVRAVLREVYRMPSLWALEMLAEGAFALEGSLGELTMMVWCTSPSRHIPLFACQSQAG